MTGKKKARIFGGATQPNKQSFSMNQSCHDSMSGINFLSDLAPKENTWDDHRSNAQSVQMLYEYSKNLTNMLNGSMAVQASSNSVLVKISSFKTSLLLPCSLLPCLPMAQISLWRAVMFRNLMKLNKPIQLIVGYSLL